MSLYTLFVKPYLFCQDPETVHERALRFGRFCDRSPIVRWIIGALYEFQHPMLQQNVGGVKFRNPIGLSAGFDKNGELVGILPKIGFGYMQVGTITDKAYEGNPTPRLTRMPKSKGILVNYGLKNDGADVILRRVATARKTLGFPVSISIGKTNCYLSAVCEHGIIDQIECLKKVKQHGVGDWYTLNISCPNTYGGEPFTEPNRLDLLLSAWFKEGPDKPTYLKMPINLPWVEFQELLEVAKQHGVRGVIIGNLNKDRRHEAIKDTISDDQPGGISGHPTKELSNKLIAKTYQAYGNDFVIVGVGGVFSADDAYEKIRLGASLVQMITGMIYRGPGVISDINRGIVKRLKRDGFASISEAVGAAHRNN